MTDKELDTLFKQKLNGYEEPVEEGLWSAVEASLDKGAVTPLPHKTDPVPAEAGAGLKSGSRRLIRRLAYCACAAAALVAVYFLFEPNSQPYIRQADDIAILDENPSEPEKQPIERTNPEENPDVNLAARFDKNPEAEKSGRTATFGAITNAGTANAAAKDTSAEGDNTKNANRVQPDIATPLIAAQISENKTAAGQSDSTNKAEKATDVAEKTTLTKNVTGNNTRSGEYMAELGLQGDWSDPDENVTYRKDPKSYTMALASNIISGSNVSVSSQYLNSMASASSAYANANMQEMEIISEAKYSLPLNLGLQAQVKVNSYLSVGVGINYTLLQSKYDGLINKKFHNIKQSLHYIGIPVNVYFTLMDKKGFYFYANLGGVIEKGVRASYKVTSYDGFRNTHAGIDGFQYSANAGIGIEYRFIKEMGLYLEPNLVYYFNSDIPASIRTDQPLQVKAEIGFRFHFK